MKKVLLLLGTILLSISPSLSQYSENTLAPTRVATILSNLRVYVDMGTGADQAVYRTHYSVPITGGDVIARPALESMVAKGLRAWTSVLPDFHFRIVGSPAEANMLVRFRNYGDSISGNSTAEAWIPQSWNSAPDFNCGATAINKTPANQPCDELLNNVIMMQSRGGWMYPDEVETITSRMVHEYYWDMSNLDRKYFVPKSLASPTTLDCVDGKTNPSGTKWLFQGGICIPYSDLGPNSTNPPAFRNAGKVRMAFDIPAIVQHEFGHTILGWHTNEASGQVAYRDDTLKPVHTEAAMIRKRPTLTVPPVPSYSSMYNGQGDASFNTRGVFELDADRLAQMRVTSSTPNAYRTIFPRVGGAIRMVNSSGQVFLTTDWISALDRASWRNASGNPFAPTWFISDVYPKAVAVQKVAPGYFHTLAVKVDGTLWGWGKNNFGQASGDGTTSASPLLSPKQIKVSGLSDNGWVSVAAGNDFSVALRSDGTVYAWGGNTASNLGDGSSSNRASPVRVCNSSSQPCFNNRYVSISAGALHVLALQDNGSIWGWGYNGEGQVGNNSNSNQAWPVREATNSSDWLSVSAGSNHSVGLKRNGTIRSWGYNGNGQLGDGTTSNSLLPIRDAGLLIKVVSVQAGSFHSIALLEDQSIWSWGQNNKGQVGTGSASPVAITRPSAGPSGNRWLSVSGGAEHGVAIQQGRRIFSWGDNQDGQIGDNSTTLRLGHTPENTIAFDWTEIYAKFFQTLALKQDGTLWGWGYNEFGQLGNGSTGIRTLVPVKSNWTYGVLNCGNPSTPPTSVNLTTEGALDWTQWGQPSSSSINQRNIPNAPIAASIIAYTNPISMTRIGSVTATGNTGSVTYSWTNGKPTSSSSGRNIVKMTGVNNGWQITVPASTTARTLKLYVGVDRAVGRLELRLSDGSAPTIVNTGLNNSTGVTNGVYTVTFASAANARNLTARWTMNSTSGGGSVTLQAATLK